MIEEARKRDHNKLGRELELFTTVDYIGQGLPILLPKFFFLFIATVSIVSKVIYCLLGVAYIASGVLDILYRKKIL